MRDEGEGSERQIATISKSDFEEVRIYLSTFKGKEYFHIRSWVRDLPIKPWLPTKKGIAVHVSKLGDLKRALDRALEIVMAEEEEDETLPGERQLQSGKEV